MDKRSFACFAAVLLAFSVQADFRYRSEMTVSGYAGGETLSDLPVLIRISEAAVPGFAYGACRKDGRDIRFVSMDRGTVYPHEVERWDVGGESLVWVRVPSVSGRTTKFLFLFGDPASASPPDPSAVWKGDGSSGYRGVWHFSERSGDGRAVAADSARHDPDFAMDACPFGQTVGTVNYVCEMTSTDGVVGNARFVHRENPSLSCRSWFEAPGSVAAAYTAAGRFAVSGWFSAIKRNGNATLIGQSGDQGSGDGAWQLAWEGSDTTLTCATADGSVGAAIPDLKGGWTHLTVVYDGTAVSVYTNGTLSGTGTAKAAAGDNGKALAIGARSGRNGEGCFWGAVDEIRLVAGVPSADRVQAEYASMRPGFVTAGAVLPNGTDRLIVEGDPMCASDGLPAYGDRENLVDGQVVDCRAPEGTFLHADGLEAEADGWTLYDIAADGTERELASGDGAVCTYTHTGGTTRRLVWSFALKPKFLYEATLTVSGYTGTSRLEGFPLPVRVSPERIPGFSYGYCRSDGADIQFLSPDGKYAYAHETERWDPLGESLVWVRVPELAGDSTRLLFRFGYAGAAPASAAKETWSDSAGGRYAGVWHFGEEIGADDAAVARSCDSARRSADLVLDAVAKNTQNNASSLRQMTSGDGKLGLARVNSVDANNNYLEIPSYDSFSLGSNFTFTGWFRLTDMKSSYSRLFGRSHVSWSGDGAWSGQYYNNSTTFKVYQGGEIGDTMPAPDADLHEWVHLGVVFDGYAMDFYTNGVLSARQVKKAAPADNGKTLILGANNGWSLYGLYDEVRLLSARAPADWILAEYRSADAPDFVVADTVRILSRNGFSVSASEEGLGVVTPGYGTYAGALDDGTRIACSAADALIDVSPVLKAVIRGWKLYEYDENGVRAAEPYASSSENTLSYVHEGGKVRELEWQVAYLSPVVLSANREAVFYINGEEAVAGTNWVVRGKVTLRAVPTDGTAGDDWSFNGWTSDGTRLGTGDEIEIDLAAPVAIAADYTSFLYVSTDGDDASAGTKNEPFKTLTKALSVARPASEIFVGGGLYEENIEGVGVVGVKVSGGYGPDGVRDLVNDPTVFKAASAAAPVLRLESSWSNAFSAIALTGGSNGIFGYGTYAIRFGQMAITNNAAAGARFEGKQGETARSAANAPHTFVSSFIARNGSRGIEQRETDWSAYAGCRLLNCTIVSNGSDGVFFHLREIDIVNCVLAGNGGFGWNAEALRNTGCGDISHSVIFGNAAGGVAMYRKTSNPYCHFGPGVFRLDPMIGADGVPAAGSPATGVGADLSGGEDGVTEDLRGRPWNGVYDLGCVKTAGPSAPPALRSEVYVSTTGDDTAAGDAANPVRTINRGLYLTAEGGVCRVAAGRYAESVLLGRRGVTLRGAGRTVTFIDGTASARENAVVLAADNTVVEGFDIAGAWCGIRLSGYETATNTVVRDCSVHGNFNGIHRHFECRPKKRTGCQTRISRVEIRDNDNSGLILFEDDAGRKTVIDNSLVAANGWNATPPNDDSADRYNVGIYALNTVLELYQTTVVSNKGAGVCAAAPWAGFRQLVSRNGVFADNGCGWKILGSGRSVPDTVNLFDNDVDLTGTLNNLADDTNAFLFADAGLDYASRRYARPLAGSPASRAGERLSPPWDTAADLLGVPRPRRKPDLGCYSLDGGFSVFVR